MTRRLAHWLVVGGLLTLTACTPLRSVPEVATVKSQMDARARAEQWALEEKNEREIIPWVEKAEDAVVQGDRAEFAEFYSEGPVRERALLWFDTIQKLPVKNVNFGLAQSTGESTATEQTIMMVIGVRLKGYDEGTVESQHRVDFEFVDDRWIVAKDEALSDTSAAPWELPDVRVRVGRDVIVFGVESNEEILNSWLETSQEAAEYVKSVVPYAWSGKVIVILPGSNRVVRDEGLSEIAKLGGVALPVDSVGYSATWMRVMIPPASEQTTPKWRASLLRHEITHVAVDDRIYNIPLWLSEGVAEWVGEEKRTLYLYDSYAKRWYPKGPAKAAITDANFHRGDWGRSYSTAYFEVVWLTRTEGADAPWRLITAFHKAQARTHVAQKTVMKKTLGITPDQMAQQATTWMLDNAIPDP